jgi:hydrogenase maturation factor
VHVGFALNTLSEEDALETLALLKEISTNFQVENHDELSD